MLDLERSEGPGGDGEEGVGRRYVALYALSCVELGFILWTPRNQKVLLEAVRRYEDLWIPFLALAPPEERTSLVPPLDVEWVWHCHMLAPFAYERDLVLVLRKHGFDVVNPDGSAPKLPALDHRLLDAKERLSGKARAKVLWAEKYPNGVGAGLP